MSSWERVVNLIVADRTHLPLSQLPEQQVSAFECLVLLSSFRYLATSVLMGWNKCSQ